MPIQAELPILSRQVESVAPTPLQPVQLHADQPAIWCKLEYLNPSGSTKDRIAAYILSKAWREGTIGPGSLVCEASSGSTSIAMAMVCAQMGLKFIAVMQMTKQLDPALKVVTVFPDRMERYFSTALFRDDLGKP